MTRLLAIVLLYLAIAAEAVNLAGARSAEINMTISGKLRGL
jgi:hypothetical protein